MKKVFMFIVRFITIVVFAGIIAGVGGWIFMFISYDLLRLENVDLLLSSVTMLLFGIVFGYRLNDLLRDLRQKKSTLSSELLLSK